MNHIALAGFVSCIVAAGSFAAGESQIEQATGMGVTVSGKQVLAIRGTRGPWSNDIVKEVRPEYPYEERLQGHQGSGLFHLIIDPKTGAVSAVSVARSIGFPALNESVVKALRQWRLKPHTWKALYIPVAFQMPGV